MAQSAFEGFYGQVGTGYENNRFSNTSGTTNAPYTFSSGNQNANGLPLIIGLGYNYSIAPKWLLGMGIDYSVLSQETSAYRGTGNDGDYVSGAKLQASNRANIFLTPGYAIDKDKLVYLKAGYSMVTMKQTNVTSYTDPVIPANGGTVSIPSQNKNQGGYIVGLGYKQMIASGFYGFAEANYMSYSKTSFAGTSTDGTTITAKPSLNSYQALVGVGYKF